MLQPLTVYNESEWLLFYIFDPFAQYLFIRFWSTVQMHFSLVICFNQFFCIMFMYERVIWANKNYEQ